MKQIFTLMNLAQSKVQVGAKTCSHFNLQVCQIGPQSLIIDRKCPIRSPVNKKQIYLDRLFIIMELPGPGFEAQNEPLAGGI